MTRLVRPPHASRIERAKDVDARDERGHDGLSIRKSVRDERGHDGPSIGVVRP